MFRRASRTSLGTVGAGTIASSVHSQISRLQPPKKLQNENSKANFLWEGRGRKYTMAIMQLPWNMWYQTQIIVIIIYKYVIHFLLAYYLDEKYAFFDFTLILTELIFLVDLIVHLLHKFWPAVRLNLRVYRRSCVCLTYDALSLIPFTLIVGRSYTTIILVSRWLTIGRIYRAYQFFKHVNEMFHRSRMMLYIFEHMLAVTLVLHASTCIWYFSHLCPLDNNACFNFGYPQQVNSRKLHPDSYLTCWYYCACRIFNVIFGDLFPLRDVDKLMTTFMTLFGYVFVRYQFIGVLTWEMVLQSMRRYTFVDRYHHMVKYLKFHGAPTWLVEQAKMYKKTIWTMKDGVLTSNLLQKLPLPLQMELIFDVNVGHFHHSLLFRDTGEAFKRQISLLMRHEIYLAGQDVWSQGVVKNGMICIKQGVIEMLSDEDDESPIIAFKEGTVLGELSLFYSIPSKVTVKAATYVELQVLRRTDFMRGISEHPFMLNKIREKINSRLGSMRKKQETIIEYDKGDSRLIRTHYRPMKVLKDNLAGVEEEDPTFVDDSHMYYKDENDVRLPKFTTEFLELYQMTSKVTTIDAPRLCLRESFPWILEPNTSLTYMFDVGHFLMVICICTMAPSYVLRTEQSDLDIVFLTIIYAGLIFNVYIQLTTAIFDKNVKKETVKQIAEVKMASFGFYLDIISLFPAYIFTDTLNPKGNSIIGQIAKLLPVLQVWHVWDYVHKWMKNFDNNAKLLCLFKFGVLLVILCYWSGCFLYFIACPKTLCIENSWMSNLIHWETKVFTTTIAHHENPLTTAVAFGTAILTGSGTSDMAPGYVDLVVVVFIFILGTYLSCIYTARISSIFLLETQRKLKFKNTMRELSYFLTVNHVSSKIKARVKKFFCVQWYYNNGVSTQEIFNDMSTNIQQEVLSIEMVETLIQCPIFQDCNRDFLQTVAANSRTIVLPDNEIVQHGGDIGRDMYIIQKGHCNLLNHHGKVDKSIGPGDHFGEIEMLYGLPKVYTVLTTTNCILLHVEYSSLVQSWGTFPDINQPIVMTLEDAELVAAAKRFEAAKPLTGRMDAKINRIAKEIKESFVMISNNEKIEYTKTFDKLGIFRFVRYFFLSGSITPHGIFLKIWCALRFLTAFYYILVIPYNIATKHSFLCNRPPYWADIVLYVDIIVMAYVAYYNERSLLITHPLLTVSRYFKGPFILDAISIFPIEYLLRMVNNNADIDIYRMNRVLLVTRITGAFSYWESDILSANPILVLLKFLPVAITLVNFATAVVFIYSCEPYMPDDGYYVMVNCSRVLIGDSYKPAYAFWEYIDTFYWVFEIFVGCGCTAVPITSHMQVWINMVLRISGFLYFSFMFGYVASTKSTEAQTLLEHKEKTRDLADFLYQEGVDLMLTEKTLKYFEYVWKRTNGSNPQQICRCLNTALMEDTLVYMYERALREVPLFGRVERSFIRVITQHLHEMYFLHGDTIIQCRDVQPYIYIIYKGKVDVLTSYNEMLTCMGPGGMFGNFTGQPISCSAVAIYASRSTDLLVIPSQTFFNLVKYYPKIQEPLNKAFEVSKDYILPITMDIEDNSTSEDSEVDLLSLGSGFDSRSGSSRFEMPITLAARSSQSNISQAKSSASGSTHQSIASAFSLLRPGSLLFQVFGYCTCVMATFDYVLDLYALSTLNDCFVIFWLQALCDVYFYIKVFVTINQKYISKHGRLIVNISKCRKRYFKHKLWLWSDILANFPLELFGFIFDNELAAMHFFRLNRLFRLKYLVEFYKKTSAELTNNITTLQVIMTAILVILLLHTFTCMWVLTLIATSPMSVLRILKIPLIDEEAPPRSWDYISSFYVVISELTMTGGDEFVVNKLLPMTILIVSLVCGKMLAATVVATAIQVAHSSNYALTAYERCTQELIDVLKNQGLSKYQLKKFWNYVQQLWITERGRQLPVLLAQAPYVRRCDLMCAMFSHHLRNCYLFSETGEPFIRQLSAVLDYTVFYPGNYIVVAGDCDARMHWVASGVVAVVSVRPDLTEINHERLTTGDVFGILQGLNKGVTHCFTYRAETQVSILTLSLDSWVNILPFFPEARNNILEKSDIMFAQL